MAPTPEEQSVLIEDPAPLVDGSKIVISGMAGLYPQSHHVKDLDAILYNKVNPITEETCRWKFNHPEVPNQTGNIPRLEFFDAQFFKVHYRLSQSMDAMARKVLEQAYQAIYDAGINPHELSGKKVGVYCGSCFSESEKACFYVASSRTGFGIAGCSKTMFANRVSYWLNVKGPSMSVDEACCSSIAALELGYQAIARGECEAAIVAGTNVCLHPQSSLHYARIMKLCQDGKTKSFDANADGCAKSEAINVLFLQKAKDAKRIYAEVLHVKNEFLEILNSETGPRYGFYRDPKHVADYLKTFYDEAKVPPQAVEYVEAFGSAVPEADKAELEALEEVFCKNRRDTLLVGSVMSNIGYGEAASGISAITKVLLGYQRGEIAANLHCENPRRDIASLRDGRMQIVTDHKKFNRSYTAVNGISVTGVNSHVLLRGCYKEKNPNRYKSAIPHLVTISGRQDTSVQTILKDLKSRPVDPEEIALFHNIHKSWTPGHLGRGYTILSTNDEGETVSLAETASYFDNAKRPLWFVYSGMGSQWAGMGKELMRIPIFAAAIERCRKVLEPKGVDIVHIITAQDKTIFDNILNSFVGIAAIQIGLTDILKAIGLVPDNIIGHSVGELGCAYADGCFTAEEMILSAYSRGLVSVQTPFIRGSMAAVGLGYEQIKDMVPPEIEIACHNGPESSTISGPADVMKRFVSELTEKGIFAKEVPCSNIAYHSRYIAEAGPGLLKYLSAVIKDPKPRSERWLSTSVPQDKWDQPAAKYSSAEYHTNNLLSSVLFDETSRLVPANAVLVEIAPHGLLQAILKRSLPESCKHIPLTRRGHDDNVFMVLDAIGKLYMEGYTVKVDALYPKVQFPVSTGTAMLSHLVEWAHNEEWLLPLYSSAHKKKAAATKNVISIHDDEHTYLRGHVIRGQNLYPFAAVLVAVWDTLAMSLGKKRKMLTVEFNNIHLYAQPVLHDQRHLRLQVTLHRGTGQFEATDEDRKVATGYIVGDTQENSRAFKMPFDNVEMDLSTDDVYQILHERDYGYQNHFRSIYKANSSFTAADIIWDNNWVTFLDGVLQLSALNKPQNTVTEPFQIKRLCINLKEHSDNPVTIDGKAVYTANVSDIFNFTRCGGVLIEGIQHRILPAVEEEVVSLKTLKFVPRFLSQIDVPGALQVYLQMTAENINKDTINVLGVVKRDEDCTVFDAVKTILDGIPGLTVNYDQVGKEKVLSMRDYFLTDVDVVVVQNLSLDDLLCQILYRVLPRDTFIINAEEMTEDRVRPSALYRVVSTHNAKTAKLELVKWRPTLINTASTVVTVRSPSEFSLLAASRKELPQKHKLVVISSYPAVPGLKDLIKEWRKDTDHQIYLVMVADKESLDQLPDLDLAYSILNNGVWGGEYYLSWKETATIEKGLTLRSGKIGDLDSLEWVEASASSENGIPVTVHYAALNNLDVKKATGMIPFREGMNPEESSYCMDFSGVTDSGQRVMGVLLSGAACNRIKARPELLWPVPDHWSLEDAVTVPSAYMQAIYCYVMKQIELMPRCKVLVHGGAGGLGQAAIALALGIGCEVFTTVSDVKKKRFLMKLFPKLKEDHIANSRDRSFGDLVRCATQGEGCDIVISCVKGELKNVSLSSTCHFGANLDTNQLAHQEEYLFEMSHLNRERNYISVDFSSIIKNNIVDDMKAIQLMISAGIAKGYIQPLTRVTYPATEVSRAFRLLASSNHRGRVVLRLRDSMPVAQPRLSCSPDLCHVIVCDESTLGSHLADRLIARGARKLIFHSQIISSPLRLKIKSWKNLGVNVLISSEDLSNNKDIVALMSDSNRLGPVEGIYVMAISDRKQDKLTHIVAGLDLASRKLCPSLRYFAIVSAEHTIGQQVCLSRVRDGLPAITIKLSALKKTGYVNNEHGAFTWRGAVSAVEQAIRSSQPSVLALPQNVARLSLLEQIAKLAEIKIPKETAMDTTLQDLNVSMEKLLIVQAYLRDMLNVCLDINLLLNMSIQKIRELEVTLFETEFKKVQGLGNFFSYVDPDELMATTELVFLPTQTSSGIMRDDDFDVSQKYLCIIPGMEGHHERFRILSERLKMPTLVLQPGLDLLHETLRETAERYARYLLNKIKIQDNFYLLGYESGVIIALEVAAILEDHGLSGTVYCVGGTPEQIQAALLEQISDYESEERLQDEIIRFMFTLMSGTSVGVEKALEQSSWKEKVKACVRILLGTVPQSAQYVRAWIEAVYTRVCQLRKYKVQPRQLRSKLILLRASDICLGFSMNKTSALMQQYSKQPVVVYNLSYPLAHSAYDLRCGAVINRHLDEQIQEAFNERDLCEMYVLNVETFMQSSKSNS